MRSVSSLVVVATSLLVREVVAGRYDVRKRAAQVYEDVDEVIVTAEVVVTDMGNGVYATGAPVNIGTVTIDGTPVLITQTSSSSSSTSTSTTPAPAPTTSAAVEAEFIQSSSSSVYVAPTTSAVYVAPVPTTTSTTPAPKPTTLATSTTTTSAAPVATAVTSSSGKRGLSYNNAALTDVFASDSEITWAYNWGSTTSAIASTLEYVPMLWGLSSSDTSGWSSIATAAIASGCSHLLGFNEPDYSGQADLTTAQAATGWTTYLEPFAGKAKLVSPAVTNGGAPMGLTWLNDFVTNTCADCTIDAVAIHWYNGGDASDFQAYIEEAYTKGGNRPVWITEWQAPSSYSTADAETFVSTMLAYMDASPIVERYAYFMASEGVLLESATELSSLGSVYATTS